MMPQIKIGSKTISEESCFFIAEIGHNHGGEVGRCKEMIEAAVRSGVDAVKLQKRENRVLFTKAFYNAAYNSRGAYAPTYGAHREFLEFGFEEYRELKAFSEGLGVVFFATAFDFQSVDFLEKLGVGCHKVSSFDLLNTPLQRYIAKLGKPVLLSTGGGTYSDIQRAYETIKAENDKLIILHCTTSYPTEAPDIHLLVIEELKKRYPDVLVGFSDHFMSKVFGPPAYVLGARVFEKHFTLGRKQRGTDQSFSLEPSDMAKYIRDIHNIMQAMDKEKGIDECEVGALYKMGKKLVASRRLEPGTILAASDVRIVSPNDGLPPYHLGSMLGKRLKLPLDEEQAILWEHFE